MNKARQMKIPPWRDLYSSLTSLTRLKQLKAGPYIIGLAGFQYTAASGQTGPTHPVTKFRGLHGDESLSWYSMKHGSLGRYLGPEVMREYRHPSLFHCQLLIS